MDAHAKSSGTPEGSIINVHEDGHTTQSTGTSGQEYVHPRVTVATGPGTVRNIQIKRILCRGPVVIDQYTFDGGAIILTPEDDSPTKRVDHIADEVSFETSFELNETQILVDGEELCTKHPSKDFWCIESIDNPTGSTYNQMERGAPVPTPINY